MKVFITGITSFVGQHLADGFRGAGHQVHGSSTRPSTNPDIALFRFGDEPPARLFDGCEVVIHVAWGLRPEDGAMNERSTQQLVDLARSSGVKRQIFLSSQSARADALTPYGVYKFRTEKFFDPEKGDLIVRPGLVVGDGGLFKKTFDFVASSKVVPLIGGGHFPMPLIGVKDLVECLLDLATRSNSGVKPLNLFYPRVPTQREFFRDLVQSQQWSRVFVPVPGILALSGIWVFERFGLKAPVSRESVRAALHNEITSEDSHLPVLLGPDHSYESLIKSLSKIR